MAAPCDACVFLVEDENVLKERIRMALKLGYRSIIINNVVEDMLGTSSGKGKKNKTKVQVIRSPQEFKLSGEDIAKLKPYVQGGAVQQHTRFTAVLTDVAQAVRLRTDETIQKYDIIAVQPTTEKLFQIACQTLDIDLITLDMTQKMPFYMKRSFVHVAKERGIHFEICYSPMIVDESARTYTISTAQSLVKLCKGRNLIISSGARKAMHMRGPSDVAALGLLFNLTEAQAKDALTTNCRALLMHSKARRSTKTVLSLNKASELPAGGHWAIKGGVEEKEEEEKSEEEDIEEEEQRDNSELEIDDEPVSKKPKTEKI